MIGVEGAWGIEWAAEVPIREVIGGLQTGRNQWRIGVVDSQETEKVQDSVPVDLRERECATRLKTANMAVLAEIGMVALTETERVALIETVKVVVLIEIGIATVVLVETETVAFEIETKKGLVHGEKANAVVDSTMIEVYFVICIFELYSL